MSEENVNLSWVREVKSWVEAYNYFVIDAIEILKIVKSYEDFINTNTLPLTNTE